MPFSLIDLPYSPGALAPAISAETLSLHHGKHHQGYIDKTNKAVADRGLAVRSLEELIADARANDEGLFNNFAQSWNHGFYWHSLCADRCQPSEELMALIESAFGSLDGFNERFIAAGGAHFASGWVWLTENNGELSIEETHDADTLADSALNPLLVLDVWEHAYYLDHQNRRPDYLAALAGKHLNWRFASENLARGKVWRYPS